MKKDLFIITNHYPYLSAETFLENEIKYLCKEFESVYIFSIDADQESAQTRSLPSNAYSFPLGKGASGWKYYIYPLKGVFNKKRFKITERSVTRMISSLYIRGRANNITKKIHQILKANNIEISDLVIYSFWFTYQAVAAVLLADSLKAETRQVATVSRAHGYDIYWERVRGNYLPFQNILLKEMMACFPCSDYGRRYLLEKYPWASEKIIVERLGTEDHGIASWTGKKIFATCCNLEPIKRMSLFAQAFCLLSSENPEIEWICIGDGEEKEKIIKIIQENHMENRVHLQGKMQNQDVMKLYRNAGIMFFVNVSTTEGVPVSIMEAMSFGIPVIATDVGGSGELVDCENGLLIDPNIDSIELSGILQRAISTEKKEYERLRINSRTRWEKLSSAERNYTEFAKKIANII